MNTQYTFSDNLTCKLWKAVDTIKIVGRHEYLSCMVDFFSICKMKKLDLERLQSIAGLFGMTQDETNECHKEFINAVHREVMSGYNLLEEDKKELERLLELLEVK